MAGADEGVAMIKGLQHFAIIVSEEKAVTFYKCLGFEETFRRVRDYDVVVMLEGYGITV